jgi:hypothetical protein
VKNRHVSAVAAAAALVLSCAPATLIVRTPDVLIPVSLSPVASTSGRAETNSLLVVDGRASAYSRAHYYCLFFPTGAGAWGWGHETKSRDSVQTAITVASHGAHDKALVNAQVTLQRKATSLFVGLAMVSNDDVRAHLRGSLVRVK